MTSLVLSWQRTQGTSLEPSHQALALSQSVLQFIFKFIFFKSRPNLLTYFLKHWNEKQYFWGGLIRHYLQASPRLQQSKSKTDFGLVLLGKILTAVYAWKCVALRPGTRNNTITYTAKSTDSNEPLQLQEPDACMSSLTCQPLSKVLPQD